MSFFSDLEFLTTAECERAVADVHLLRGYWDRRNQFAPFYTLGAASYIDAAEDGSRELYATKAAFTNPLLEFRFGWMYERLLAVLERRLAAPVKLAERFARPGFHIFMADRLFEQQVASVHVDRQYDLLDWPGTPDFSDPLSFTAPVSIPRAGAGLNNWDVRFADFAGHPDEQGYMESLVAGKPPRYHAYQLGRLVLHSGHMVHQIAPMRGVTPGAAEDSRITLQGHAVCCDGTWLVYW